MKIRYLLLIAIIIVGAVGMALELKGIPNLLFRNKEVGINLDDGSTIEAPDTRRDYFTKGNQTDALDVYDTSWAGSTFTIGARTSNKSAKLTSITVWLKRVLSPGNLLASVRAVDGSSKPTGPDLDSVIILQAKVGTAGYSPIYLEFKKEVMMKRGTQYAIVLTSVSGNGTNKYQWDGNADFETEGEAISSSSNGTSWSIEASDLMMVSEIFGVVWD